ncbi:diguanylate cyclase [Vibrio sp. RE86]|nr:diguanylate cyclase [Vibrio sp. RE86]
MIVGLYFFYITLERLMHNYVHQNTESVLSDIIYEIREDAPAFHDQKNIDRYIDDLTQADAGVRIQIIDPHGIVVGDTALSDRALVDVENHSSRPEYQQAWDTGSGEDIRFSQILLTDLFFLSKKEYIDGQDYVVVLSVPMYHLKKMTQQLMGILLVLVVMSIGFLLGTSIYSHRKIEKRVREEQAMQDKRIMQRTNEIELMHRLANMLAACGTLTEAQKIVEDILPRILGKINGSVSLMRASRNQLVTQLDWGDEWPGNRSFAPEECWSLRKGRAHQSNDDFHTLTCDHMSNLPNNQTLCIPLTAHGNTIGILHLYFGEGDIKIDPITNQLAFSVAEHLGLALANLSLQEKLRSQALSDPLTGLFNRRFFEQKLEEYLMRSASSTKPLSLLMLDLDHFKRFNDNFGHDAGDFVLKEVSALLQRSEGEEELSCRLGGEELAVLLPGYTMEEAVIYATKLCKSVRSMHLEHKGLSLGQLGVSIGVATYPDPAINAESLIKLADQALYLAKETGRSRVVDYDEYMRIKSPSSEVVELEDKKQPA